MNINDMSYRQWQKRNTDAFQKLTKEQQAIARQNGYFNLRWQKVQHSWVILQRFTDLPSLFDAKLKKDDLTGAVNQSILEADQAQKIAKQSILDLEKKRKQIQELASAALNNYQLL